MDKGESFDIRQLFTELRTLSTAERKTRLGGLPPAVQTELRGLLDESTHSGPDLDQTSSLVAEARADLGDMLRPEQAPPIPAFIDNYWVISRIGAGSYGVVYEAEEENPHRSVALKVIHHHLMTPNLLRRFKLEIEFLGRLEHPGIARIYEAGTTSTPAGPARSLPWNWCGAFP